MPLLRGGLSLLLCLILSPALAAQNTLSVSGDILTPGQTVVVSFHDATRAGDIVTVIVEGDNGIIDTLHITLDAQGKGSVPFLVPSGHDALEFVADDASRVARPVDGP